VAPEGTRIDVLAGARDASVVLHVVDQGPGMTATERARAFDRLWRAPNAPQGGTGLGLAIVRHLVTAAGGTVELRAGPGGRGIDAVVVLPRAPVPSPAGRPTAVAGR
jgi:signal transduction histidine kinase